MKFIIKQTVASKGLICKTFIKMNIYCKETSQIMSRISVHHYLAMSMININFFHKKYF